ncbi:MAG TPA: hypothetical protein VHC47_02490 [Mucilaginibacter sp.]|nr:hypothetical protein [Mucilaginibacter sp.]
MKQGIGALILFAITFASCQKDSVAPSTKQKQVSTQSSNTSIILNQQTSSNTAPADTVNGYLRLQLAMDSINTDGILIDFKPGAKAAYVPGEDAPTMQGFGKVSLSSLSSDNIPLAINTLPLAGKSLSIGLKVNTSADGIYSLKMCDINSVPASYDIWLMDKYKKDSLDMSYNKVYAFNLYHADTASFGSNRFKLVIRQK